MFDIHPIVWLQSWASPTLTGVMNGISLLGYTRAYIAIAVLLVFAFRQRAAVALLVLIVLNGAFTDIAKAAASTPRPDADLRVQALSLFDRFRERRADTPTETEDSSGFPSGHVSATTTFAIGLAMLLKWRRRGWMFAVAWMAAMAISRMYLGRHFPGDVLGGVGVGLVVLLVGFAGLQLGHLARESRVHHPWPAHRVMTIAIVMAAGALLVALPDAGDAGRLLGIAIGVLFLVHHDVFAHASALRARALLLATAIVAFAGAWMLMSAALTEASPSGVSALRLAASALPTAAVLIVPACIPAWVLSK
jgi:membrane-associated phospholipid phosphatase